MHILPRILVFTLLAAAVWRCETASGLTIKIDYSIDDHAASGNKFFSSGNPLGAAAGAQARAALNAAAAFYSNILEDSLAAIQTPPTFFGSLGGSVTWYWQRQFPDPQTGSSNTALNMVVPANEYVVFVGARNLGSSTLGSGGPGGWSVPAPSQSGGFTSSEVNQIQQTHNQFVDTVTTRGETSGFARWGGALAFDIDGDWHFNHTTAVPGGKSDFYSVALHELAHTFGFGASQEWNGLVSGASFVGPESMDIYHLGGPVPLADAGHWSTVNTGSTVYGGSATQQPIMTPSIPSGQRRFLTDLDAAGLVDIGWEIDLPEPVPGDYNRNGIVDAADYTIWRNTLGSTTDLRANGNNSGASANKIDQADYTYWKTRFGNSGSGAGGVGIAVGVPEPNSLTLLLLTALAVTSWRSIAAPANYWQHRESCN